MRRAQADFVAPEHSVASDRRAAVAGCGARSPIDGIEVSTLPEVPRATAIAQGARCSMLWVGFTATQRASDPGRRAIRHLGARRSSRVGAFGPSIPDPDGAPRAARDLAAQNTGPRAKSTHPTRTALPAGRPIVRPAARRPRGVTRHCSQRNSSTRRTHASSADRGPVATAVGSGFLRASGVYT